MNKSKLCGIIQLKKCGSQRRKNQEWCSRFHGSKPCGLCYFDRVLPPAFFPASHIFLDIPFLRVVIFYNPSYIKNDFTDFSKHSRKEPPQACSNAPFNNQIQYSHFSKNPHQRLVFLFLLSHGRWACIAEHVEASKPQYCVKVISTGGSWACRRAQWPLKHYSKRKI